MAFADEKALYFDQIINIEMLVFLMEISYIGGNFDQ
jgi:hypothetical protein